MGAAPEEIRHDIDRTRSDLSRDIDRLAERANLRRLVRQRSEQMRDKARHLRDRMMGSGAREDTTATRHSEAPGAYPLGRRGKRVTSDTIMLGVAAFGAGLLIAFAVQRARQRRS